MRIAFAVFKYFPHGGLQADMLRIARAAAARGHKIVIYTSDWQDSLPQDPQLQVRLLPLKSWTNWGKTTEFEKCFLDEMATEKFDLKVVFNRIRGGDFYFAADNCLLEELPKEHIRPVLRLLPRYRTFLRQEKSIFSAGVNTSILYITERQKQDYIRHYGTESERFLYLPPGMNNACRRPQEARTVRIRKRAELHLGLDTLMILQVGALTRGKGCDRSLAAVASLPPEYRPKVQMFFAGSGQPAAFQTQAKKCGLMPQVHFLGPRQDIPELLLAADLMLHPARNESAGSVLIEGIAAGIPVLCSGECGFSTFVREAAGLVTETPFRQDQLNQMLLRALKNLPDATAMTEKYAETADFYSRADRAVDFFENKARQ